MQTKPLAHDEVDREVGKHLVNVGSVRAVSRFPRLNAEDWGKYGTYLVTSVTQMIKGPQRSRSIP